MTQAKKKPPRTGSHTPPGGRPPGHRPDVEAELNYVISPQVVEAINGVAEAIKSSGGGGGGAPPVDLTPLVAAIVGNTAAINGNTAALDRNSEQITRHAIVLREHVAATEDNTEAIAANTVAINALTETLKPAPQKKASRITLVAAEIDTTPPEGQPMPPLQCHPTDNWKVTFGFNGAIDGEPAIVDQVPFSAITQDPKVETPAEDDPTHVKTTVTVHGHCTEPDKIVPGAPTTGGLSCQATVDDPSTGDTVEEIFTMFDDVIQWVPPSAQKATSITIAAEIE